MPIRIISSWKYPTKRTLKERHPEQVETPRGLDSVAVRIKIEKDRTQRCFRFTGNPGRRVSRQRARNRGKEERVNAAQSAGTMPGGTKGWTGVHKSRQITKSPVWWNQAAYIRVSLWRRDTYTHTFVRVTMQPRLCWYHGSSSGAGRW